MTEPTFGRGAWPRWMHSVFGPADWAVTLVEKAPGTREWKGKVRDVVMDGHLPHMVVLAYDLMDISGGGDPMIESIAWASVASVRRDRQPEDDGWTDGSMPWVQTVAEELDGTRHLGWGIRFEAPHEHHAVSGRRVVGTLVRIGHPATGPEMAMIAVSRPGHDPEDYTLAYGTPMEVQQP
jgi:hypothetical protein